ncbi:hypothetical protein F8M41_013031 [Gigaspora margarita]|uniref:Uncharacterized protein n=1 Tax=Gigaspora margarita TaxID=4874 RepID=A0A8H4ASW6_GIGMA|nr:hypothetical protein F8M41_013031 [Gigaspora margarita]
MQQSDKGVFIWTLVEKAKLPEPNIPNLYETFSFIINFILILLIDVLVYIIGSEQLHNTRHQSSINSYDNLSKSDVLDNTFENINYPMPNFNPRQDNESDSDNNLYKKDVLNNTFKNINYLMPNINPRSYLSPDELTTLLPIPKRKD